MHDDVMLWIINKKFEGAIELDDQMGQVIMTVSVNFNFVDFLDAIDNEELRAETRRTSCPDYFKIAPAKLELVCTLISL